MNHLPQTSSETMLHNKFRLLGLALLLIGPATAQAQVAISVGAEEIYDDNIYLESDGEFVTTSPAPATQPVDSDGKTNDDLITHVYAGVSGALPISPHLKSGAEAKVGMFSFLDETDESRITLDTAVKIESENSLIPDPYFAAISSQIVSGSTNISVAEGSAARQSQTHVGSLQAGIRKYQLAPQTDLSAAYTLARHDFLGEWTFSDRDNREEEEGSDYFSHGVEGTTTYQQNEKLSFYNTTGLEYLDFTSANTNSFITRDEDDLNRYQAGTAIGVNYAMSEQFKAGASVGVDYSRMAEEPTAQTFIIIDENGSSQTVTDSPDRSQTSLAFGGNLDYLPDQATLFRAAVSQSNSVDVDGGRITVRSYSLNANREFNDRVNLLLGGRFVQYTNGDSLSNATDRTELSAALSYALNEALNLSVGWNYADQSAGDSGNELLSNDIDYESTRAFVGLSGGFLGLKK